MRSRSTGLGLLLAVLATPCVGKGEGRTYQVASAAAIESAMKEAQPGDRLVMKNGLWRDADIRFRGEGTAGAPITLAAETPGEVVLTGSSRLRIGGRFLVVDGLLFRDEKPGGKKADEAISFRIDSKTHAYDCRLTNTAVIDFSPTDGDDESKWVSIYGLRNRVDHCAFWGKTNLGTTLVVWLNEPEKHEPNGHRIDHNYFGPRPRLDQNGGETIRVGDSKTSMQDSRTLVEDNYFYRANGEGEIISNKSCENIYRANTFVECEGALTLRHGNRCRVEGNFFLGQNARLTGGVRIIGEDHTVVNNYFAQLTGDDARSGLTMMEGIKDSPLSGYFQVKRALVAFNTFVDVKYPFNLGEGAGDDDQTLPPVDSTIANNLVLGRHAPLVRLRDQGATITYQGNLFWGAELGIDPVEGIRSAEPKLAEGKDGLWRPTEGSPALDAAVGAFDVAEDMEGQPRDGRPDVGADERSTAPAKRRPLGRSDVGPNWSLPAEQ